MSNLEHTLNDFQLRIINLAISKGWTDDLAWLGLGMFKEIGELWQVIETYQNNKEKAIANGADNKTLTRMYKRFSKKAGSEFAGAMHYILQSMYKVAPDLDLDKALANEITRNSTHKKKTYKDGKIVRR